MSPSVRAQAHQVGVAGTVRRRPERREPGSQVVDRYRDMLVLVGVDADDHLDGRIVAHNAVRHVAGFLHRLATPSGRAGGQDCDGSPNRPLLGHCPPGQTTSGYVLPNWFDRSTT